MTTPPFFSLVIVNYRSAPHLHELLGSLYQKETDLSLFEVIIVNNDPQERGQMAELAREFPLVRILESLHNRGFGAGVNQGAKEAEGTILGVLNPDLVWKEALLPRLQNEFLSNPSLGVAGLALQTIDGAPECWSSGQEPTLSQIFKNNIFGEAKAAGEMASFSLKRDWVSGGALFVPASFFESLGGFDEKFFLYFEDVDLCSRVREKGLRVRLFPRLAVVHKGGRSHSALAEKKNITIVRRLFISGNIFLSGVISFCACSAIFDTEGKNL